MKATNQCFTGSLLKPIDLDNAPARGLRATFALPPDESDKESYKLSETNVRWAEIDKIYAPDANPADIWSHRLKAVIYMSFEIALTDPDWNQSAATRLAEAIIPGFSVKKDNKKAHGRPLKWDKNRYHQIFADIENLKKLKMMSVRQACDHLSKNKKYAKRWRDFSGSRLRKAYTEAVMRIEADFLFRVELIGAEASIPRNGIDAIDAAIALHALRV